MLVPTVASEGHAFPLSGAVVGTATAAAGSTARVLVAATNTGASGTILCFTVNSTTPAIAPQTIPTLALSDVAGGPTASRAMKAGITVTNRTQMLNMGGQVSVLNAVQRVSLPAAPSAMTQAQWDTFMDSLVAHPKSRIYSGTDFARSKTFICHPLDQTDYVGYRGHHGTQTGDEFWSHIAVWPTQNPEPRPMSTIFMVFEVPSTNNTYEFKTRASFYTRWPLDTVPGQAHRPVPTADPKVVNALRDHAEATGHVPRGEEAAVGIGGAVLGGLAAAAGFAAKAGRAAATFAEGAQGLEMMMPLLVP